MQIYKNIAFVHVLQPRGEFRITDDDARVFVSFYKNEKSL